MVFRFTYILMMRFNTKTCNAGLICFFIFNSYLASSPKLIYFLKCTKFIKLFPTVDHTLIIPYINKSSLSFTNKKSDIVAKILMITALMVINLKSSTPW